MNIFERIQLGYFLCAALSMAAGIMLTVLAYERFGEAEEAEEDEIDEQLFDIWE